MNSRANRRTEKYTCSPTATYSGRITWSQFNSSTPSLLRAARTRATHAPIACRLHSKGPVAVHATTASIEAYGISALFDGYGRRLDLANQTTAIFFGHVDRKLITRLIVFYHRCRKPGLETPSRDPHSGCINFRTAIQANLVTTSGLAARGIAGVQVAIP